jgi:protein-tyrosine-phosphatase
MVFTSKRRRRVRAHDFKCFDLTLGMSRENIERLAAFCPNRSAGARVEHGAFKPIKVLHSAAIIAARGDAG